MRFHVVSDQFSFQQAKRFKNKKSMTDLYHIKHTVLVCCVTPFKGGFFNPPPIVFFGVPIGVASPVAFGNSNGGKNIWCIC